jgi:iron-sulfur cluster repair protein YtfE (RIC family)
MPEDQSLETICQAAAYFSEPRKDPREGFEKAGQAQLALCDQLEQIADSIPGNINRRTCSVLAEKLNPLIRSVHRFEEDLLYPLTRRTRKNRSQMETTIKRLKHEHFEDECFAEELVEALRELSLDKTPENPEATGYMLRGFFEALRRHVAFEREHLEVLIHEHDLSAD